MTKTILTGIKPTGTPHLGNYFGTLEPTLRLVNEYDRSYLFIANYHALNQIQDAQKLEELTLSIAATWLACGLDATKTNLYAQSDVPEVFELETIISSFTPKGWMNKAHAYKAASDSNAEENRPVDDGINMGLYTYPILMAADILIFDANVVPVGKDQVQHVEIARDIAQRINNLYSQDLFVLPEYRIEEQVGAIPGLDGRKMSKSYDNVIPLFASVNDRQQAVNRIVTDSTAPDEPKSVEGTALYDLYKLVASDDEVDSFKQRLEQGGIGWGEAKKQLGEKMNSHFADMTNEYYRLMDNADEIRQVLREGAERVRPIAQEKLAHIRKTMGII